MCVYMLVCMCRCVSAHACGNVRVTRKTQVVFFLSNSCGVFLLNPELVPSATLASLTSGSPVFCLLSAEIVGGLLLPPGKFHGHWRPELKCLSLDSMFFYSQPSPQFSFLLRKDSLSHRLCPHFIITFICLRTLGCSFCSHWKRSLLCQPLLLPSSCFLTLTTACLFCQWRGFGS